MDYKINIVRKNIKNIYIKIEDDGSVTVKAGKKVSDRYINEVINSKKRWIEKKLENIPQRKEISSLSENILCFLGREYKIKIINTSKEDIYFMGDNLVMETQSEDIDIQRDALEKFLGKEFMRILMREYIMEAKQIALKAGIVVNARFRVRAMKSRFGSYSKKTEAITLNLLLSKYDKEVIMSVILHEIAHIRQMDHSKKFYDILLGMMPDYRKISRKLKNDFIYEPYWFLKNSF